MIFFSAGHSKNDPGAPACDGSTEAIMTIALRDRVIAKLKAKGAKVVQDIDTENLGQYLARIQPGEGSVVCEVHFNAVTDPKATGTEVLIPDRHTAHEMDLATHLCVDGAKILGIKNRGVKTEGMSHRGKLGLMREEGMNVLIEVCFISNPTDLAAYKKNIEPYADMVADAMIAYDAKIA